MQSNTKEFYSDSIDRRNKEATIIMIKMLSDKIEDLKMENYVQHKQLVKQDEKIIQLNKKIERLERGTRWTAIL